MNIVINLVLLLSTFNLGHTDSNSHLNSGYNEGNVVPIIEHKDLSLYVDSEELTSFFSEALFDDQKNELRFITKSKVHKITIYSGLNKKVYMLPVKTNKIKLGMSMFDKGSYELVFEIKGEEDKVSTMLEVF